jgi:hypothetical protein
MPILRNGQDAQASRSCRFRRKDGKGERGKSMSDRKFWNIDSFETYFANKQREIRNKSTWHDGREVAVYRDDEAEREIAQLSRSGIFQEWLQYAAQAKQEFVAEQRQSFENYLREQVQDINTMVEETKASEYRAAQAAHPEPTPNDPITHPPARQTVIQGYCEHGQLGGCKLD